MPRRSFLTWDEPALPQAADVLADEHQDEGELDLDRLLVVLPGRRAGRRLTELLVQKAEDGGLVLTPPRTTTLGALPEYLYEPDDPLADIATSRLQWVEALRSLPEDRLSVVFPDPPAEDDLSGWMTLASAVGRLHREVSGALCDFAEVARICNDGPGFDDSQRWRALAEVEEAYHERLTELGRIDRSEARRRALREDRLEADRDIVLMGVVEMPGVVEAMLRDAEASVRTFVHAPEERSDAFDDLGCVRTPIWTDEEIDIPAPAIAPCGRPPSQADEVVRRLSGDGSKLAPDQVTVGVPDEEIVPYLEQRFRTYGIPHRHGAGVPLDETAPCRLLSAVAGYLDGARFPDFAALVRHPEIWRGLDEPGLLQAVDERFNERLPSVVPWPTDDGEAAGVYDGVVNELEDRLGLSRFGASQALSEWMSEVVDLLRRAYSGRRLDRSDSQERETVEALEVLRDLAGEMSRLPEGVDLTCSGVEAIRILLSEVREREKAVPPAAERSATELLGWLELHLDDAPVLVITGLDEDHVPASANADVFLPDALRSRLGLVDNERRYARDAYLLSAILASRDETHIVVGRRDAQGDPRRPSRLLLATSGRPLAERARRLFAEETSPREPLSRLDVEPAETSTHRTPPEPELAIPEPPGSLAVKDFSLLLKDPYRWVLENQLGLEGIDDRARELDPLKFGSLAHEVLEQFGRSPDAESADAEAVRSTLHDLLDQEVEGRYGDEPLPAVRLQVEQLRARLSEFAEWQAERVRTGWEIVEVEVETPKSGLPLDVDDDPIGIRGRIDRVDRHRETGRWEILDYKTSAKAKSSDDKHRKRGEWVDAQLPLYHHLVPGLAEEGTLPAAIAEPTAEIDLGFVNLARDGTSHSLASWGSDDIEDALESAREVVRLLRSGEVEYSEGVDAPGGEAFDSLLGEDRLELEERPGGEEA